jgi:hypothetical protein
MRAPRHGILLGWLGLLLWPVAVVAAPCPAEPGTGYKTEVVVEVPPAGLRHDLGRDELGEIAFHGTGDRVLGLTTSSIEILFNTEVRSRTDDDGTCFWVPWVKVTLRYSALDIYIANEYAATSCPYQAILAHERRHTEIARKHLQGYVQPIRSALASLAIPRPSGPIRVASAEDGEARMKDILARLLAPIRDELTAGMRRAQARVDTRQAYRRVNKQCRDW